MTLSGYLFAALIRPRFSIPIGALAIAGLCWWGASAYRLVRQVGDHAPTAMSFPDAVRASKDGEVYVRLTGATPDCTKTLRWSFGTAIALVDANGEIAAMGHFEKCPVDAASLEGIFLEPPAGLYGRAVARGWGVTRGHLALFEPDTSRSRAWTRIGIALIGVPLILGCIFAGVRAGRAPSQPRSWQMRALGLGMMAAMDWFSYYAHEYVIFGVLPAMALAVTGFAAAAAIVVAPNSASMKKVARVVLPTA